MTDFEVFFLAAIVLVGGAYTVGIWLVVRYG